MKQMLRSSGLSIFRFRWAFPMRMLVICAFVACAATASAAPAAQRAAADKPSEVGHVRAWNSETYTRIVIDLGDHARPQAKYQAVRITNPDRIYFDIQNAALSSELLRRPVAAPRYGYLKTVRLTQSRGDVVRVVLELSQVKDYSVFELSNPNRLVIDVYGLKAQTAETVAKTRENSDTDRLVLAPQSTAAALRAPRANKEYAAVRDAPKDAGSGSPQIAQSETTHDTSSVTGGAARLRAATKLPPATTLATSLATSVGATLRKTAAPSAPATPMATNPGTAAIAAAATPNVRVSLQPAKPAHAGNDVAEGFGASPLPEPMHDGTRSLTRALGLKTGRIVIDAGHGGHDTGTKGPSGLMEKDVCLDVALRVGKLVSERLPAAEIVYTRKADKFVSLEKRTAVANEAKADLFLSIHANSSENPATRGIETYYLNFGTSPEALDVAMRENVATQSSVHDLQALVSKIARNEKTAESREFATEIQEYLAKRVENATRSGLDRGVRQAPFAVLIGANMPSVLAEISFLSNPADERWLAKSENRERVADGLYHGIEAYLQSTNSLTANLKSPGDAAARVTVHGGGVQSLAARASSLGTPQAASGAAGVRPVRSARKAPGGTTTRHSVSNNSALGNSALGNSASGNSAPDPAEVNSVEETTRIVASRRPPSASGLQP